MPAYAAPNRRFAYAATTSLALHALVLLLSAPALRELPVQPFSTPQSIVGRIVEQAPQGESIAPQMNKAQSPKREVRKRDREKTAPAAGAAVAERAAPTEPQSPTAA